MEMAQAERLAFQAFDVDLPPHEHLASPAVLAQQISLFLAGVAIRSCGSSIHILPTTFPLPFAAKHGVENIRTVAAHLDQNSQAASVVRCNAVEPIQRAPRMRG